MKKLFLLLVVLCQCVFAQNFNFNSTGEKEANSIVENFIEQEFKIENSDIIAYKYNDLIFAIVKNNLFYTLEGYKLLVLKLQDGEYKPVKSNVFFDNTANFSIDNNKITFHKTVFYKNKKSFAYIKDNEIKTHKSIQDYTTDRKVKNIEQLTRYRDDVKQNNIELTEFKTNTERKVKINYKNLNEKTKHYIEMR